MSEQEFAYLAGIIDGEGSICLHKDGRDGRIWGEVSIYNTSQELITWIQERFGGNVYKNDNPARFGSKQNFVVRWYGRESSYLLPQLIPYLVIKKEKAKLLYDLTQVSKFSGNGGQDRATQETIYEMFKELGTVYTLTPIGGE